VGTLFVIGRPLVTETLLATMEALAAREEIHVVFVQGGVVNASDENLLERMSFAKSLSCLDADSEGVEHVDYLGWLNLIEVCEKIVSWT
jgi:hypothetical protein